MQIRNKLLNSDGCKFTAEITADYGTQIYNFTMECQTDNLGNLTFTVTAPETICGITGSIDQEGGKLTFDEQALAFSMLADGQVTPVNAPYLMMKALRSGYISAAGEEDSHIKATINDSYADNAMRLEFWMDQQGDPCRSEILWKNKRILSLDVSNFQYL